MLFSEWFKGQAGRTDEVGAAAKVWLAKPGLDRRGRVNADRLAREPGISQAAAEKVIAEYKASV